MSYASLLSMNNLVLGHSNMTNSQALAVHLATRVQQRMTLHLDLASRVEKSFIWIRFNMPPS